jgi:hypothetical protein
MRTSIAAAVSTRSHADGLTSSSDHADSVDDSFIREMDAHNELAYSNLMELHSSRSQWKLVNVKDGVSVHKYFMRRSPAYLHEDDVAAGKKHAIVRSSGIIDAPPSAIFDLFLNNERVKEYNEHCT